MVHPSPPLSARLRLTTKQVNRGFYKGNRTGSMGAHTEWGGYMIDYRKTRNFACPPNLAATRLSPFVTRQIAVPMSAGRGRGMGDRARGREGLGKVIPTGEKVVRAWKEGNRVEYERKRAEWKTYLESLAGKEVEGGETPTPTTTTTTTTTMLTTGTPTVEQATETSEPSQPRP